MCYSAPPLCKTLTTHQPPPPSKTGCRCCPASPCISQCHSTAAAAVAAMAANTLATQAHGVSGTQAAASRGNCRGVCGCVMHEYYMSLCTKSACNSSPAYTPFHIHPHHRSQQQAGVTSVPLHPTPCTKSWRCAQPHSLIVRRRRNCWEQRGMLLLVVGGLVMKVEVVVVVCSGGPMGHRSAGGVMEADNGMMCRGLLHFTSVHHPTCMFPPT